MATTQDWVLEPQQDELSRVICTHCQQEIGKVYTASATPTGRDTGRSEEEIGSDVRGIVDEHLPQCSGQPADPRSYENELPNTPPQKGPAPGNRR